MVDYFIVRVHFQLTIFPITGDLAIWWFAGQWGESRQSTSPSSIGERLCATIKVVCHSERIVIHDIYRTIVGDVTHDVTHNGV